jgi:uncharacterized protein YjbI with pentapeptide repeats
MANPEHLAILKLGVEVWNNWRVANPQIWQCNLEESDMRGTRRAEGIGGRLIRDTNLINANFQRAMLRGANLQGMDLSGADLRSASFNEANLSHVCLRGANLAGADLQSALLVGADCSGARFDCARLRDTAFGDTNLSKVDGLELCIHWGPSSLDYRTLAKSRNLPLPFLRGCGLPDQVIEYLPSLLNEGIQFYSCFISYSSVDQEFASRVFTDLQNKGVRCWFAAHDIHGGKKIHEQIDEAIQVYDRLLLILSDASMNSEWVKTEIANARQREIREGWQMLFPISLVPYGRIKEWKAFDADTGKDSAREIREYFIPDFSNWRNHDSYQKAFQRLLSDLKAEGPTT